MMAESPNLEVYLQRLEDPQLDLKSKFTTAIELRDTVDSWCQGNYYPIFLQKFIPVLMKLLDGQPVFISTSPEQRLRACALEILHRLPMTPTEALEPYAPQIVDKLMSLVKVENEDNDIIIVKTIMDFLRHQPKVVEDRVQPFLNLIQEMFQTMEQTVKDTFDSPAPNPPAIASTPGQQYSQSPRPASPNSSVTADLGGDQQQARQLSKGMHSFKVLSECPIIVVSIFQSYRLLVGKNVKSFIPLIKNVLCLQAKPQERAHEEAKSRGDIFTGVSKDIKNRAAFGDFILMQVKTMSFLAYLLRVYSQQLTDFLPTLPEIVIRMLKDCPRERSGARKELLVAIRHIINFNFRKIFLMKIDELLDERTLIGDGLTVYETMRPLAYSMLADLIHHLRESLTREQIHRTIEVYTKNLHDDFPGTSFQTMSAKLLLNLAECIAKLDKQDSRHFLVMILNAIGDKFAAMNWQFEDAVKLSKHASAPSNDVSAENYLADKDHPPDWDEIDIFYATPIKTSNPRERGSDPVADNKFLFMNLLHGLKPLFYQLRSTNPPKLKDESDGSFPANWGELSFGYNAEELHVLIKLFRHGCRVFRYYGLDKPQTDTQNLTTSELLAAQHMMNGGKDEKELLETFATVFHHIDPATFHEVFQSEIPHLYDMCFEHSPLLHIAQFLLASEATSPAFCGMLLQFLMGKIEEVGSADVKKASILLRLFKLSFMAVTLFAPQNERVLLPHVTKIVTKAMQLSTTADDPMNYFLLLRSLFRSIGGGRFELLYKELLPLLEMLLEVLNNLLEAARKPQERDLFVELILTVPARLSNLLPHLSYLMRPLVVALGAGSDLVGQGLRTLELCVDNLTADYIDPIMAPVIDQLMTGLWDHLKPTPYPHFHAHTTMRILGKLGGRNRKFLNGLPPLNPKPYTDDEASFGIKLIGTSRDRPFPVATGVDCAVSKLMEVPKLAAAKPSDGFYKQEAFRFIEAQVKLHIGLDSLPEDFAQLVRLQATDLASHKHDIGEDLLAQAEREKSSVKRDTQQETLKTLLKACHFATSIPELKPKATALLQNVCRHFTVLEVGRALAQLKHLRKPFDVKSGEGPLFIDSRVIADAISESLASDNATEREAAEASIVAIRDAAAVIFGSQASVDRFPFFIHLYKTFAHNCYQEQWYLKAGGTLGIKIVTTKLALSDTWMVERHYDLVRALVYVLKDMPLDITSRTRQQAQDILEILIRRCTKAFSKEDLKNPQTRLQHLCKFMVLELAHMNKYVREAAQKVFAIIAEVLGVEVQEVLFPVKDMLLTPIFNKPLRALPFGIQIGYIDAINFCLKMPNNLVPFEEPLTRLLMESLALADAEDETLSGKPTEHRNAESIVNLRVGCIRLLSTAQNCPEFHSASPNQSRQRIIAVFFRSLYSKSPDVVEAAYAGLKGVLANQQKLPKDLLQSGLRPILMNLQDHRKLTVEGLEGLARLLKLLTNYFKVEIGARLLDHMKHIADPLLLQQVSFTLVEQSKPMRVIAATLNIFHLLPPAAHSFLSTLVQKVIEIETGLRRTYFSPFREPLIKYLNQYPKEAWEYFQPKMRDHAYGRFFAQILADPEAGPLRSAVASDVPKFLASFNIEADAREKSRAAINAIHVACSICQHQPTRNWLVLHENLRKELFDLAKSVETQLRSGTLDPILRLAAEQAGDQAIQMLTVFLEQDLQNFDFFFEVVEAVTAKSLKASPTLTQFIYRCMISSDSIDYWRSLVIKCIDYYASRATPQKAKTYLFHFVVNPILAMDVQRNWANLFGPVKGTKLVDKAMIDVVLNKLWKPLSVADISEETGQLGVDHARMELLQLTALLLKYHANLVQDTRKEIIKFSWNWIRLEDVINKYAAYVVIAYFIAHYDTPAKIAISVYQTLLKAHQNEGRALVSQSLELMADVLKKRIGGLDQQRLPLWARLPKRILAEDSQNLQQLMCIFNFFVRHPDLFYEAREHLAPAIIPSLQKVAALPMLSNDSKKMAINLIDLIWKWEKRAHEEFIASPSNSPSSMKRKADGTPVQAVAATKPHTFVASSALRWVLIKYLVQFIASLTERFPVPSKGAREPQGLSRALPPQPTETCHRAVRLLCNLLQPAYWSDLDVLPVFPKVIEQVLMSDAAADEKYETWLTRMVNTLQILKVFVNVKPNSWVMAQLPRLQTILEKSMRLDNSQIQDCLHGSEPNSDMVTLFKRLLDALPERATGEDEAMEDDPAAEFLGFCSSIATEALSSGNLISAINLLWSVSNRRATEIDQHVPGLIKAFNGKLAKDHLSLAASTQQTPVPYRAQPGDTSARPGEAPPPAQPDTYDPEIQTALILKVIDVLAARIDILGDQRRPFLSALATLVERSQSKEVCMKILDLAEFWIFNSEGIPTLKEKVAVLTKMYSFESRSDPSLLTKFLKLVLKVYEDQKVTRTELTVRLEHAFLLGTRAQDVEMRNQFLTLLDKHISRSPCARLDYLLCEHDWAPLGDTFWLSQVIQLLIGSIDMNTSIQLHPEDFRTIPAPMLLNTYSKDSRVADVIIDDRLETFMDEHKDFCKQLTDVRLKDIMEPLAQLQHTDRTLAQQIWVSLFPIFWAALPKDERSDFEQSFTALLTKDFHSRQIDQRPNCVQALLEGAVRASPRMKIPPHVMKFLAKTYNAWYVACYYLEEAAIQPLLDTPTAMESSSDALIELYATLDEYDLFYGTWRRRCNYVETNAALSYEQIGMWDKAQQLYETAQIKARTGVLPFSQGEYMLWEDHWVVCAQKLQQWEILQDFAKHENFNDLYLESTWRNFDAWQNAETREQLDSMIKSVSDAPTPRRLFFQAFMSLLKVHSKTETPQDFSKICDEAIQNTIRKWNQMPKRITNAHVPLLQSFQHLVELYDALTISTSLHSTNQGNLDQKSQDLKMHLGTWRDRLPNFWDDINAWQDLVTWRQHIFNLINSVYLNLIPPNQPNNTSNNSYAYRGYHETAWIINRFAHVARQHNLPDVCIAQLSRIYTLPNIEIQEAFLKLREQAKCHYQNKAELSSGLDVINNTNLNYFGAGQKAEFYTLKGMFLNKLGHKSEANDAFGSALYFDIKLGKAWAEWGHYNDQLFKEDPKSLEKASSAISCYLEASSLYKNHKSRKLLGRILWLLSLDDAEHTLAHTFDQFKGDTPVWYWITYIPQLLLDLSRPEAPIARQILLKLAKAYPQALFFQMRTTREDMHTIRRQQETKEAREKALREQQARGKAGQGTPKQGVQPSPKQQSPASRPQTANGMTPSGGVDGSGTPNNAVGSSTPKVDGADQTPNAAGTITPRKPWEYMDEIMAALKTAFPLLAWSMEAMVDQIGKHFKCQPDEDAHRLIVALLNDGLSYVGRQPGLYAQDVKLPQSTEANITRFAESVCPPHIRRAFEADFVRIKPTMHEYIQKLRKWRNRFEERLDRRASPLPLEHLSPHLSEFRFQKFDEVEVPGQYLKHRDKNQDFIRVDRFLPDVDLVRGTQVCHRRLKIRGHDGSIHSFSIQSPAGRYCRREERILQLFRIFNEVLLKRKESRRRNLQFNLPLMVPLSPGVRMVEDDPSYTSLQSVFEDYCRKNGMSKDNPILHTIDKLRALNPKNLDHANAIRLETFVAITETMVPQTIALEYFKSTFQSYDDFWLFRRAFSYQFASLTFMTYVMFMTTRYPHKLNIARGSGRVWGSELVPSMGAQRPAFNNPELVPFRLTPNLQVLMGPLALEGIFAPALMVIARCLTEREGELEMQLSVFVRDEVSFWFTQQHKQSAGDGALREAVQANSDSVVRRARSLAQPPEGSNLPANQTVVDLVASAANPKVLSQTDPLWMAYL
ncbi:hypothetical protein EJ06DRAFT_580246 [Trichodelitschia bisporula]|uniref:Non-specific serine/threonine protein kinase n=1 Tax=Trichodelitschia bisporula TaxID=703511 RepID=A0A6G1I4F1_9PEZI|nr:hypothetical protein EJ06DRAFT_580246 [Trichodelitschia bisporula]